MKLEMRRENFYLIVLILTEISLIIALIWFASHSECVTHAEFLSGMGIIGGGMSAGFWAIWSSISALSKDVGYIKGRMKIKS